MDKPYSDRRWHDDPKGIPSLCGTCKHWLGFGKCKKYEGKAPKEILDKSFPNTQKFDENYCEYRQPK